MESKSSLHQPKSGLSEMLKYYTKESKDTDRVEPAKKADGSYYDVVEIQLSPVQAQHYWASSVKLQRGDDRWRLYITDVFAVNKWNDDTCSTNRKLPERFPDMTAQELANFINSVPAAGPYEGGRRVKPEEVMPLLQAAKRTI